jgi:hypothetical protein
LRRGTIRVNRLEIGRAAAAIEHAACAPVEEQREQTQGPCKAVREYGTDRRVDEFLEAAISGHLTGFPGHAPYLPAAMGARP